MDKVIRLYKGDRVPFPSVEEQIITSDFVYTAKRMGGAPTITCSIRHKGNLNEVWGDDVYTVFNGEKFHLRRTPSSTYDNTDVRYKYDLEFVSERIALENTLFYDVVLDNPDGDTEDYTYITRNTRFQFYGTIHEFVQRLNASFKVSGLPFRVESKDDGVSTDGKMVSFEDKFLAEALQEIYNTYEYPYYYDASRKTFIVGHNENAIVDGDGNEVVFEYGGDKSLVSVTKSNANHKLINRITGYGSEDNIPSYYPNETPKGKLVLTTHPSLEGKLAIKDSELFSKKVDLNENVEYKLLVSPTDNKVEIFYQWGGPKKINDSYEYWWSPMYYEDADGSMQQGQTTSFDGRSGWEVSPTYHWENIKDAQGNIHQQYVNYTRNGAQFIQNFSLKFDLVVKGGVGTHMRIRLGIPDTFIRLKQSGLLSGYMVGYDPTIRQTLGGKEINIKAERSESNTEVYLDFAVLKDDYRDDGRVECFVDFKSYVIGGEITTSGGKHTQSGDFITTTRWQRWLHINFELDNHEALYGWAGKHLSSDNISRFGLEYLDDFDPSEDPEYWVEQGIWFGQEKDSSYPYITPQKNLMPSTYRKSYGRERFYNAVNNTYEIPEDFGGIDGTTYEFPNPFEGYPREHIQAFEDIKPTIVGIKNTERQLFNEFLDVAFDEDDNDETDDNGKYIHPYFYVKLPKYDGEHGFNLFDHSIDEAKMTISMLNGMCGGCEFVIGVTRDEQKNPVQVRKDENGNVVLLRDSVGNVVHGTPQKEQNDTKEYEVWIALQKDIESYGEVMPNQEHKALPKAGDSFVLLHIQLPKQYITAAEDRLEKELIQYMHENNVEKFTFSMKFSRIYLAENTSVLHSLDENVSIWLRYEGKKHLLYASSYTYKMTSKEGIPEILVDISDTITTNQSALDKAVAPIKADIANRVASINFVERCSPHFLRKDVNDTANGKIHFAKGATIANNLTSDDFRESHNGVGIFKDPSGLWHIESDCLKVRKTMYVENLDVATTSSENGQKYLTSANSNIDLFFEFDDVYRCFFLKTDANGNTITNKWKVGDQAYHHTYNLGVQTQDKVEVEENYYWRKVVGVSTGNEGGEMNVNGVVYHLSEYHYIDLSKNDCAPTSGVPSKGDVIVQLGHQGDDAPERQNAIVLAGAGDDSPYIRQYVGINSFKLPEPDTQIKPNENILSGKTKFKTYDKETGEETGESTLGEIGQNLEVGVSNLLRNSGFTGDYETADLTEGTSLKDAFSTFSPSLEHWEYTLATAQESEFSQSGKEVYIESYGGISQTILHNVRVGEDYIFSFYGKGGQILVSFGGELITFEMTEEWKRYSKKVRPTTEGNIFTLRANDTATLCDIMLEKGNVLSEWTLSPLDNRSELAKYESLTYLQNLLQADTVIDGGEVSTGIVNTGLINMGHYDEEGNMVEVTSGISGTYNNDDSVAFFGGGDLAKAIYTVQKYKENPNYEPTTEELASMAKAVITHGGRAILQDIILRGYVYAEGGVFRGTVYAKEGVFNGGININRGNIGPLYTASNIVSSRYTKDGLTHENAIFVEEGISTRTIDDNDKLDISCSFGHTTHGVARELYDANGNKVFETEIHKFASGLKVEVKCDKLDPYSYMAACCIDASGSGAYEHYAILCNNGMFAGLRTRTKIIGQRETEAPGDAQWYELDATVFSVMVAYTSGTCYITLPAPQNGQELVIDTLGANLYIQSKNGLNNIVMRGKSDQAYRNFVDIKQVRLKFYATANEDGGVWLATALASN